MTLYDRVAATPGGARRLAEARLRREALRCLHRAYIESGLSAVRLAAKLGVRPRMIRRVFDGGRDITVGTLARYLHAMGYEAEIRIVPAGEPRRKIVEGRGSEDWDDEPPPGIQAGLTRLLAGPDVFADDEPGRPNQRIRAAVGQMRADQQATPERDGYTIGVFLPPGVSETARDKLADGIAAMAHQAVPDVEVVGLPGDPLGAVDGTPRP